MMNATSKHPYAKTDGYDAVEMPYDGKELSLLVVAPTKRTFAFEASLTGGKGLDILASLETKEIHLFFPKRKTEGAFELKEPLKAHPAEVCGRWLERLLHAEGCSAQERNTDPRLSDLEQEMQNEAVVGCRRRPRSGSASELGGRHLFRCSSWQRHVSVVLCVHRTASAVRLL